MRIPALTALLAALCWTASLGASCAAHAPEPAPPAARRAEAPRVYETRGVIRSFGPDRAYANIKHEAIPGYMEAMTMSFEARDPAQLAPFAVDDRVAFSFTDDDGRRVIQSIKKE